MRKLLLLFTLGFTGCGGLKNSTTQQLKTHYYEFRTERNKYRKIYAQVKDDSVRLFELDKSRITAPSVYRLRNRTLDLDVISAPFKYRPSSLGFPRQLNANFNGHAYLGYRIDKFKISKVPTPGKREKLVRHFGISGGVFGGIGSEFISPWTTNYRIMDEYDGFALTRGAALMFGLSSLTLGFGVGWDRLTDRDKNIWIYQNKPWFGVTIGLHLN